MDQFIIIAITVFFLAFMIRSLVLSSKLKKEVDSIQSSIIKTNNVSQKPETLNRNNSNGASEVSISFDEWMKNGGPYLAENLPKEFINEPYEILFGYKDRREDLVEDNGGMKKIMNLVKKEHVHSDDFGELFRVFYKRGNRYYYFVKVINGTPEPDGSYAEYFLEVPPDMETAKEAVAWTYGLHPDDYNLIIRT